MKFSALATDYDGTIAQHGDVSASTREALARWKESGRKLILVTGRELPDLLKICPFVSLFDRVIAENGGLLYAPATQTRTILGPAPPKEFVDGLRARGVTPLSLGKVIVATRENYKGVVLETIEDLGLKLKVILNKGAVMVLPIEIDKASGLRVALAQINISPADVVGVGDAENDQVFLGICGYSVAVANALSPLKSQVHFVTRASHGAGVEELIDKILRTDSDGLPAKTSQLELPEIGRSS